MSTAATGLHLDARQRAMLQEMGVTVWAPAPVPSAAPAPAPARGEAAAPTHPPYAAAASRQGERPSPPATEARSAAPGASAAPLAPGRAGPATSVAPAAQPAGATAPVWRLHAVQPLFPTADPAQTPAALGKGWLVVAECGTPTDPLGGSDAGRLLCNMLRAMELHRHPRVFLAALERTGPGASAHDDDVPARLAEMVGALQPDLVLVLGHPAARAALASTEPLGRLRAGLHAVAGRPAVVTYDPAFLLRSQESKAAAWADLCRALAVVRRGAAAPG